MKKYLAPFFKLLRSKKIRIGGAVLAVLILFVILYSWIPLPNIDDGYLPEEVRKVSSNAPFTIQFSQPMDRRSVEDHFSMKPSLPGEFNWPDSRTLEFFPDADLTFNDEYQLVIGAESRNAYFKRMGVDYPLRFVVTGPPYVKFISPYLDTALPDDLPDSDPLIDVIEEEELLDLFEPEPLIIEPDQMVTVMFDRPMRALTTIDERDSEDNFPTLLIDPPLEGDYRWVGTTAFQFIPDEWPMGTVYTLTLPKGIQSLDGGKTEETVEWQLATEAPKVIESYPVEGTDVFPVDGEIRLKFNQEMDLNQINPGDNVLMVPTNDLDSDKDLREDGFFNTEVVYGKDEKGKKDRSVLVFKPTFPYLHNLEYQLVLTAGLKGAVSESGGDYGTLSMKEDFVLNFETVELPGVENYLPQGGDLNYEKRHVEIDFNSPMTKELVLDQVTLDPPPKSDPWVYLRDEGRHAEIVYQFEPSTDYRFELSSPFEDAAGNLSENGFVSYFKSAPLNPSLSLVIRGNYGFFSDSIDPVYTIRTINQDVVTVKVCEVPESSFFFTNKNYRWHSYSCGNPLTRQVTINGSTDETVYTEIDLEASFGREFDQGIYFIEVSSNKLSRSGRPYRSYQSFMISDTALTLKKSGEDLLVWATDLSTGQPVGRMELTVFSSDGQELKRGVSDGEGLYKLTSPFDDGIYVVGRKKLEGENRWSMVGQYWNSGIETWRYEVNGDWIDFGEPRIYLYTERPLYHPGDTLYFKGLYRIDRDADLSLPKDRRVKLVLEDPEYNEVDTVMVSVLPDGSFSGELTLSDKVRLGRFNLYAETTRGNQQRFYHHFFVEEFKKPKFKVELLSESADTLLGDDIPVDVQANYFFGGAIQDAEVHWTLMREPYLFDKYRGDAYYSFGVFKFFACFWYACSSTTEIVAEGDGQLDKKGYLSLKLPTDQESEEGQSYLYTLSAEVKNKDGEFVAARESFLVHQGSYYIGVNVRNYIIQPGDDLEVQVITVDPEANPVSGKRVNLTIYREEWNTVKKQGVDGAYYDESVKELIFVTKKSVTSIEEGQKVTFTFNEEMKGGRYLIQAKGSDGGRTIFSESNFYLSSSSWVNWGSFNHNRMELTADRPEYLVGGKARVLVKSPYGSSDKPAKALVTYERGTILDYEVVTLESNTDVIEISIKEDMVPNVYVTVMVVKGMEEIKEGEAIDFNLIQPDFKFGVINLIVSKREQEIIIDIKTDQTHYEVGDRVSVEIHTRDYQNRPVPSIVTLAVVDESLLALKANKKISPLDYFYGQRQLQVSTANNLTFQVDRVNVASSRGAKGGDGGEAREFDKKRGEFKDTAYFNPLIETDEGGYARIEFIAPDNLTSWEIWAVASSGEGRFGMVKEDFVVRKPVMITAVLPRFVISGDKLTVGALVHNQSGEDLTTKVELISKGFEVDGSNKKTVAVADGTSERVDFEVIVNPVTVDSVITVEFSMAQDTVQYKLPVHPFSVKEVVALNGRVDTVHSENIRIPESVVSEMGDLDLQVGAGSLTSFVSRFERLDAYPYGCSEQIVSKILPSLIVYLKSIELDFDLFKTLNIDPDLASAGIEDTLQKLAKFQRFDGGYGYWEGSTVSNPFLSAYIFYAQNLARQAGFTVSDNSRNLVVQYLWRQLNRIDADRELTPDEKVFILWALSEVGENDTGTTLTLFDDRQDLSLYAQALLLMNLENLVDAGQRSVRPFVERLKSEIVSEQIATQRTIHFEEEVVKPWDLSTNRRTTAMILMALNRNNSDNPILSDIVNYLVQSKDSKRLLNTQETAWVLMAMLEYSVSQGTFDSDFTFDVFVNNSKVLDGTIDSSNLDEIFRITLPISELLIGEGVNEVSLQKEGEGDMNFDLELTYYLPNEDVLPLEEGIHITRNYYRFNERDDNKPVRWMKSGTIYRGQLNLIVPEDMYHVVVEERLPAGVEAINFNLDTADISLQQKLEELNKSDDPSNYWIDNPLWYFNHKETRDDRVLLFADFLPKGVYRYDFLVRAGLPGRYHHLPATAYQMYFPEVFGRTEGKFMEIKE